VDAEVGGPYDAAVRSTAEPEAATKSVASNDGFAPKLINQTPAASHAPWIRPIGDYERQETTTVEGPRYG
jgi:hypothetical protein